MRNAGSLVSTAVAVYTGLVIVFLTPFLVRGFHVWRAERRFWTAVDAEEQGSQKEGRSPHDGLKESDRPADTV